MASGLYMKKEQPADKIKVNQDAERDFYKLIEDCSDVEVMV